MILKKAWVKPVISLLFCSLLLITSFSLVKQINQIFYSPKLSFDKIHQLDSKETDREVTMVKQVIDGDTIELKDGRRVRYIGINTPEVDYSTPGVEGPKPQGLKEGLKDCFGKEAKEINKELIEGKMVELEKDVSETDKYGRYLRYVYVDGIFINDWLVENGFAKAMTIPPDVKFAELFKEKERLAREEKRGLWGKCY